MSVMREDTSVRPLTIGSERLLAVAVYAMVWGTLLYSAFTLILGREGFMSYLLFSSVTAILGILASLSVERPVSVGFFLCLSTATAVLLVEEALLNGPHPGIGLVLALTGALSLSFAGSILRLGEDERYALQVTGLIFASRLAFAPFPQGLLTASTAAPTIYILIISVAVAFIIVKRISLARVGLTRGLHPMYKQIAAGGSIGLLSSLIEYWILRPSPIRLTEDSLQAILYVVIVMTVFVGFGEELLFRGLVQESYQKVLPAWSAILLASIQFSLMHYGWQNPLELLFSYGMGIAFGFSFWKTKSLATPIAMHALNNIAMFIIAAYSDLMFTPVAIGETVIIAVVLILPVLPWHGLAKPEMRTIASRLVREIKTSTSHSIPEPKGIQLRCYEHPLTPPVIDVCAYCGRVLVEDTKYCDKCGRQLLPESLSISLISKRG